MGLYGNETVEHYFKWNKALLDYYFNDKDWESVVLYVDNAIIEKIGKEHAIGGKEGYDYVDDFFSTVFMTPEKVAHFVSGLADYRIKLKDFSSNKHNQIFELGYALMQTPLTDFTGNSYEEDRCPYFNFIVASILGFQGANTTNNVWDNLEQTIKTYAGDVVKLPTKYRERISEMIDHLSIDFHGFNADRISGVQPYVGKIKYHLILNNSQIDRFNKILYENSLDESLLELPYSELVNIILSKINPADAKDKAIRDKIIDMNNEVFFKNRIMSFDPSAISEPKNTEKRDFLFLYEKPTGILSLGIDFPIEKTVSNETVSVPVAEFPICGLYPVDKSDVSLDDNLSIEEGNLQIFTRNDGYFIFANYPKYFRQVVIPEEGETYILVYKDEKKVKDLLKTQKDIIDKSDVLPNKFTFLQGWKVKAIPSWKQTKATAKALNVTMIKNDNGYEVMFGIKNHRDGVNYAFLPDGLPFIHITKPDVMQGVRLLNNGEEVNIKLVGNNIFINPDDPYRNSKNDKIESYSLKLDGIKNSNKLALIERKTAEPSGEPKEGKLDVTYNKWGLHLDCNGGQIYCDNKVTGTEVTYTQARVMDIDTLTEANEGGFKAVNLIKEVDNDIDDLNDYYLNRILKYAALFNGINIEENSNLRKLKYYLRVLGYLTRYYDENGKAHYRATSLKAVKTGRSFSDQRPAYLLYGAYTRQQLDLIRTNVPAEALRYFHPFDKGQEKKDPVLNCLPDFMLVDAKFSGWSSIGIDPENVFDGPLADSLVSFAGNMSSFAHDFLGDGHVGFERNGDYPKMIMNQSNFRYSLDLGDGETPRGTYRQGYTFVPIPTDLMKVYVENCHQCPVAAISDKALYFSHIPTHQHITGQEPQDMGLPFLIKKALCELNLGLPRRVKAFGVDKCISKDKKYPLYSYMDKYCILQAFEGIRKTILEKLTGHEIQNEQEDPSLLYAMDSHNVTFSMRLKINVDEDGMRSYQMFLFEKTRYDNGKWKLVAFTTCAKNIGMMRIAYRRSFVSDDWYLFKNDKFEDVNEGLSFIIKNGKTTDADFEDERMPLEDIPNVSIDDTSLEKVIIIKSN